MDNLSQELQDQITKFCISVYKQIRKKNGRIKTIILQYNNGEFNIGTRSNYKFRPIFYKSTDNQKDTELEKLVGNFMDAATECYNLIKEKHDRVKSYNIFLHAKKDGYTVNICNNNPSKSHKKCRIFNEIVMKY